MPRLIRSLRASPRRPSRLSTLNALSLAAAVSGLQNPRPIVDKAYTFIRSARLMHMKKPDANNEQLNHTTCFDPFRFRPARQAT